MAKLLTTIKHVVHFISSGSIRLSRQDANFVASISQIFTTHGNVTSNQVRLFNHILNKYARQFTKFGHDVNQLMALPWNINIVQSTPQYTNAHLSLIDGKIILRSPYNTKFLKYLREQINHEFFVWDKIKKHFEATFSTTSLKLIIDASFKHYQTVNCCPTITKLIDKMIQYDNIKYWDPTLVKVNDQFMIASTNPSIDDIVNGITLSDDPYILNYLVKHAINIDDALLKTPLQQFAGTYNPIIDYDNSEQLIDWLLEIKCDGIYLENITGVNFLPLKRLIKLANIPVHETSVFHRSPTPKERGYTNSIIIKGLADKSYLDVISVSKIITMVNNTPIKTK